MPIRLSELKKISQGEREKAVIEAVAAIGFATIADVTEFVARKFELNLDTDNVREAFKKTIRTDLKKLSGRTLGIAYFSKNQDSPMRVSEDDLEYDDNGKVKNIYNIKYFKFGSNSGIPGGNLLVNQGGLFIAQYNQAGDLTIDWEINSFNELRKGYLHIVFRPPSRPFFCVNVPLTELPVKIAIGRSYIDDSYIPDSEAVGQALGRRAAVILTVDNNISRPKSKTQLGHVLLSFGKTSSSVEIVDLNSTNGTLVKEINDQYIKDQLELSKAGGTRLADGEKDHLENKFMKRIKSVAQNDHNQVADPTKISIPKSVLNLEAVSAMQLPFKMKLGQTEVLVFTK